MKFTRLKHTAILPSRATKASAGYDLHAIEDVEIEAFSHGLIKTGIGWKDIPRHLVGLIWPKSGPSYKLGTDVLGGVIDADYEVKDIGVIIQTGEKPLSVKVGDSIAQMVIMPYYTVDNEETPRADRDGGFGSTGA